MARKSRAIYTFRQKTEHEKFKESLQLAPINGLHNITIVLALIFAALFLIHFLYS